MKIDITDTLNRMEAEKQVSLQHPDRVFVPVWENDRLVMVDEEEIKKDVDHYAELAGLMWFTINNGSASLKTGKLTLE